MPGLFDQISHVIFDLDGLLIDSEPLWKIAEQKALAEYNTVWRLEIARQHIGVRIDEAAMIMVKGYQMEVAAKELAARVMAHMLEQISQNLTVMSGAGEAIQKFHEAGLRLAIASSSSEDYIQEVLHQMGWTPFIDTVTSAYHVPRGKPAPDVYLEATRILGAHPMACLAFEDSVNGAKAAQAAQLRVCAIPGHDFSPSDFEGIADVTYPSLNDVLQLEFGANLPIE